MQQSSLNEPAKRTMSKVLVANRGEIAVRIFRTARACGYGTVAVYAEPDFGAPFVRMADEAYALRGTSARDSYLDVAAILNVARRSGADAVHPGYGFLSENADFAEAVIAEGLLWVGPPPSAVRSLGDKVLARNIAREVGAPMAAGTQQPVSGVAEVLDFVDTWGLPIAIKASHGGGGRGLKVVRNRDDVALMLESATREASGAFGRGECFVEQYLDRARHVEVQVLADQHGGVFVLGTRDCTLQRRFQKLVEEAPAPFLTDRQVRELTDSAVAICRAVGYTGAGTVEFLVQDDVIAFLEVNTRLQVEHPVTEQTTGIDIVREQFRIANGEQLAAQEFPKPTGHSLEFRINAEDPDRDFIPVPGRLVVYEEPHGPGIRVDSGVTQGMLVSGHFDSMLAKLVVTGVDRAHALELARSALGDFRVEGLPTVLPFHRSVVNDPDFVGSGGGFSIHTRWIDDHWRGQSDAGPALPPAHVDLRGPELVSIDAEIDGRFAALRIPASLLRPGTPEPPNAVRPAPVRRGRRATTLHGTGNVITPMTGTLVSLRVGVGDVVHEGEPVASLEAMKMEYQVTTPTSGVVKVIHVAEGQSLPSGTLIAEIEPSTSPETE